MNIFGLIPARGGSKRIPNKNIKLCAGKPLISWTIEASLLSKLDEVHVSTDSGQIIQICKSYEELNVINRPEDIAGDKIPMLPVIQHFIDVIKKNGKKPDAIMLLQPTSPLRNVKNINEVLDQFEPEKMDSMVSVVESPHAFHPNKILTINDEKLEKYNFKDNLINDEWPVAVGRNGPAILLSKTDVYEEGKLYGEKNFPYVMDKSVSIDIDEPFDFNLAELLLKNKNILTY